MYLDRPLDPPLPAPMTTTPSPPLRRSPSPVSDSSNDPRPEDPDIASLRRTHITLGYRDGIAAGKPAHVQSGFDEAYPLGGRFGLKIGWIKGVLEGLWMLDRANERTVRMRADAERELDLQRVFAREWFDEGGVWRYPLGEGDDDKEEEGVTLDRVVDRHPLVMEWMGRVLEEAGRWGLDVKELSYEGQEAGASSSNPITE